MSKHTIKGYIIWQKWKGEPSSSGVYKFQHYEPSGDSDIWDTVLVGEHTMEIDVPDGFSPLPQLIAGLEEEKRLARLVLAQRLVRIDEEISKLTCLTNEVTA